MPPEAPDTSVASIPDRPASAAEINRAADEHSRDLIAKHVEEAKLDFDEARDAAAKEAKTEDKSASGRDRSGRFQKTDQKAADTKEAKPKGEEEQKKGTEKGTDKAAERKPDDAGVGLGKARRLAAEGKIADALELIGLDPEKLDGTKWAAWRHQNREIANAVQAERTQVQAERAEMNRIGAEIERMYAPYAAARQAWEAGDAERAVLLAFGEKDINEFNKRLLGSYHAKDPNVSRLEQQLAQERARNEQWRKSQEEAAAKAQHDNEYRAGVQRLITELQSSEDPHIAKAATRQDFVEAVIGEMQKHWDPTTRTTLRADEAAEIAYDGMSKKFQAWAEVFSSQEEDNETGPRKTPANTGRSAPSERRTAKSKTLNHTQAAEAGAVTEPKPPSPPSDPKDAGRYQQELDQYYKDRSRKLMERAIQSSTNGTAQH